MRGGREKTDHFQFFVTDALSVHVVGSHLPSDFGDRTGPDGTRLLRRCFSAYSWFDVQSTIVRALVHLSIVSDVLDIIVVRRKSSYRISFPKDEKITQVKSISGTTSRPPLA